MNKTSHHMGCWALGVNVLNCWALGVDVLNCWALSVACLALIIKREDWSH